MSNKIRIGSRGSDLALWQAHFFQDQLNAIGVASELIIITTKGDQIQHLSFDKIEGKGFFTKEIEDALLNDQIDVAIHSHKDLETQSPPGLVIAGVSCREDPSELLLIRKEAVDRSQAMNLKKNAIVGTSSARRKGQITTLRPDLSIKDIRGNVPTRVNKLRSGDFDAILIAFAGIHRLQLDLSDLHVEKLDPKLFIPAPAQGVLAYQCRSEDSETQEVIQKLHHSGIAEEIAIERAILSGFGGGCHIPVGAHVDRTSTGFKVRVSFAKEWEEFNHRIRFDATSKEGALEQFQDLKSPQYPKSVFISRDLNQDSLLMRGAKANGISITAKPLISVSSKAFSLADKSFDWIFFSSSNAVIAFFERCAPGEVQHKRFACAGVGTAATLGQYIAHVEFIGADSNMMKVATAFAALVQEDRVLFPIAEKSLMTMQSVLNASQVINVICYSTEAKHEELESHDAYVFTSPSNVASFYQSGNTIAAGARVVAIGPSTEKALAEYNIEAHTADIPHEAEIFALLAS